MSSNAHGGAVFEARLCGFEVALLKLGLANPNPLEREVVRVWRWKKITSKASMETAKPTAAMAKKVATMIDEEAVPSPMLAKR